ncbi:MAG: 4Fe-4S dicluster domain-containing protein [Candidatus Glassbacteria bacterium]|nr:4Fe-4S dicluster domain-containing protein [Candidatus Glassbacteria bacterium]
MQAVAAAELKQIFLNDIYAIPDGERINQCQQCGTCSSSCPTAARMDFSPREIIAALRAGLLDRVLESNTVWMCSSCYSCTVRCPAGIKFTDVMYELKRLGSRYGYINRKSTTAQMARVFVKTVDRTGRSNEGELMFRYFMATNPLKGLGKLGLSLKLLLKNRLPLRTHRIKQRESLKKMIAEAEKGA